MAQERDTTGWVPISAVKYSPFHLSGFYPTFMVSYEHWLIHSITLQTDLGYVINFKSNDNPRFQNKRGIKVRLEPRYYFLVGPGLLERMAFGVKKKAFYAAMELHLNAVHFDRTHELEECYDLNCNYSVLRKYQYKMLYREKGFGLKYGYIQYLSDFFLDINAGLAVRFIRYDEAETIPPVLFDLSNNLPFQIPNEKDRTVLSPRLGIRLGYRIR